MLLFVCSSVHWLSAWLFVLANHMNVGPFWRDVTCVSHSLHKLWWWASYAVFCRVDGESRSKFGEVLYNVLVCFALSTSLCCDRELHSRFKLTYCTHSYHAFDCVFECSLIKRLIVCVVQSHECWPFLVGCHMRSALPSRIVVVGFICSFLSCVDFTSSCHAFLRFVVSYSSRVLPSQTRIVRSLHVLILGILFTCLNHD